MNKVLVFAGSTRLDSFHRKLALEAVAALRAAGAEATFADLRDYPMPLYDGDVEAAQGLPSNARAFKELVKAHNAIVIASPEYNGSFPALVKNAIDWISRPEGDETHLLAFRGKKAALLSTSPGPGGGQRGLRHLRELLEMIGVHVIAGQLTIPKAFEAFDAAGRLARPQDREQLRRVIEGLVAEQTASQAA
ncbi:NADPH-dependent FMN reductase [Candidatus Sulfopaludibacter sp. SbA3]|nr:NADPH-dependent FMN reductase [Candidatus Sulfopaludibacter sp. SbA3]